MRLKIQLKPETFYIVFAFLYFSISNISRMLQSIGLPRPVSYIIFLAFFLVFFLKTVRRIKLVDVVYYAIAIPLVALALIRYGSYESSETAIYAIIILFLPSYYFFRFCRLEYMQKGFKYAAVYSFLYLLFYYVTDVYGGSYSMQYAYWMAQPVCVLAYYAMKERKKSYFIAALVGMVTIFVSGSRGALFLCLACCAFTYLAFYKVRKKVAVRVVVLLILSGVLLLYADSLVVFLSGNADISRNIRLLLSGEFFESKSRAKLYEICQQFIDAKPFGQGPLASRKLLPDYPYPHSIWYEFQLDYGKWLGIGMILLLAYISIQNLIFYRKTDMLIVCSVVTVISLCGLIVSSSYWQEYCVPAEIALFVNQCIIKKQRTKTERLHRDNKGRQKGK